MNISFVVHGFPLYTEEQTHRNGKQVVIERMDTAIDIIDKFKPILTDFELIISNSDAKDMFKFYKEQKNLTNLMDDYNIIIESNSYNTKTNVKKSLELVSFDIIIPISSNDHISRCLYLWNKHSTDNQLILATGSNTDYTNTEEEVLILEPSQLNLIVQTLSDGIFNISKEEYNEFIKELERLIKKYN